MIEDINKFNKWWILTINSAGNLGIEYIGLHRDKEASVLVDSMRFAGQNVFTLLDRDDIVSLKKSMEAQEAYHGGFDD